MTPTLTNMDEAEIVRMEREARQRLSPVKRGYRPTPTERDDNDSDRHGQDE